MNRIEHLAKTVEDYCKGNTSTIDLIHACSDVSANTQEVLKGDDLMSALWDVNLSIDYLEMMFDQFPVNADLYHCILLLKPVKENLRLILEQRGEL